MPFPVPPALRIPANADAVRWLERESPSAHSDVASALEEAAAGRRGLATCCPDPASYAWVGVRAADGRLLAVATGMRRVSFRLGGDDLAAALAAGATPTPEIGAGWVSFELWTDPPVDLRRWLLAAWRVDG